MCVCVCGHIASSPHSGEHIAIGMLSNKQVDLLFCFLCLALHPTSIERYDLELIDNMFSKNFVLPVVLTSKVLKTVLSTVK